MILTVKKAERKRKVLGVQAEIFGWVTLATPFYYGLFLAPLFGLTLVLDIVIVVALMFLFYQVTKGAMKGYAKWDRAIDKAITDGVDTVYRDYYNELQAALRGEYK